MHRRIRRPNDPATQNASPWTTPSEFLPTRDRSPAPQCRARPAQRPRPAAGTGRRAALLRGTLDRRDGGGPRNLARHGKTRMDHGTAVADAADGGRTGSMTAEQWSEVKIVLAAALEVPAGQRSGLLETLCAGNMELRGHVESLLALEPGAGDFLDTGLSPGAALLRPAPTPESIGAWRVLREIGRGGMGVGFWLSAPIASFTSTRRSS